jgi:short-subunit dehydrogenase
MKVAQKVVALTGAGSGIGREIALELLRRGAKVAAIDINEGALGETRSLAGESEDLATFTVNVADRGAVAELPSAVIGRFGAVDGLINCAGIIQPFVKLADLDYTQIDRVMNVNWNGTLFTTKAFLPHLLERPEAHIVNVSSMGGFLPVPGQTVYGASKAAVKLFTEGLHSEMAGTHVHVTVVFPGAIGTNITANSGVAAPAMAEGAKVPPVYPADRAARDILAGMEGNRYRVLVGRDAKFMDLIYRVYPQGAANYIARQMKALLAS